jgi:hypothetical protein
MSTLPKFKLGEYVVVLAGTEHCQIVGKSTGDTWFVRWPDGKHRVCREADIYKVQPATPEQIEALLGRDDPFERTAA